MEEENPLNHAQLNLLLSNSRELLCLYTPDGRYLYVSPSIKTIAGYEPQELHGKDPYAFFHPEEAERIRSDSHRKVIDGIDRVVVEYRFRHKKGHYIWLETHSRPVFDQAGHLEYIVSSSRDITREKELRKELERNHAIWRSSAELAKVGIWEMVLETGKIKWSEITYSIYGLPIGSEVDPEVAYGQYVGKEAQDKLEKCVQAAIEAGENFDEVFPFESLEGEFKWVQVIALPQKNELGKVERLYGTIQDVTKEQQELNKQRMDKAYLSSILNNNKAFILRTDLEGNITYANTHYLETYGHDPNNFIGESSMRTVAKVDWPKVERAVEQCLANPGQEYDLSMRKVLTDGLELWTNWEFRGIRDETGKVTEIQCLGFDATKPFKLTQELGLANEALRKKNEKLEEFSYMLSHNIRSHASNMNMLSDLLMDADEERPFLSQQDQNLFEEIHTISENLLDTVGLANEVLQLHKDDSELEYEQVRLPEMFKQTTDTLYADIAKLGATVEADFKIERLKAVKSFIQSIFLNLLSNALKYRHPERQPLIQFQSWQEEGYVYFSVKDNGVGLDLEKYGSKLFDLSRSFHNNKDSQGIGLYIVRTQTELMDGEVWMESTVGQGSTFFVKLPE